MGLRLVPNVHPSCLRHDLEELFGPDGILFGPLERSPKPGLKASHIGGPQYPLLAHLPAIFRPGEVSCRSSPRISNNLAEYFWIQ